MYGSLLQLMRLGSSNRSSDLMSSARSSVGTKVPALWQKGGSLSPAGMGRSPQLGTMNSRSKRSRLSHSLHFGKSVPAAAPVSRGRAAASVQSVYLQMHAMDLGSLQAPSNGGSRPQ